MLFPIMLCLVMVISRGLDGNPVSVTLHVSWTEKRHISGE